MPEKRGGEFLRGLAWNIPASIGAPADLAETVLNLGLAGGGYLGHKLGLLGADQLPQLLEGSPGTTKWWTKGTPMEESADPAFVRGQLTGGLAAAAYGMLPQMRMRHGQVNATPWHGSPHKFDAEQLVRLPDGREVYVGGRYNTLREAPPGATLVKDYPLGRFRSESIGTGEGAQAYGHGLYLADSPSVANGYATKLADFFYKGRPISSVSGDEGSIAMQLASDMASGKSFAESKDGLLRYLQEAGSKDLYEIAKGMKPGDVAKSGNLYKVDLPDEMIARMLDWDKPLSQQADRLGHLLADVQDVGKVAAQKVQQLAQQPGVADWARRDLLADAAQLAQSKSPQHVAGVLKRMQLEYGISADSGPFKQVAPDFLSFVKGMQAVPNMDTGGGALSYLQARYGEKAASDLLRAQGIPGIRYLDGGSRSAGSGSYNYVIFPGEEGMLRILERNGVPLQQGLAEGPVLQKGLAKP